MHARPVTFDQTTARYNFTVVAAPHTATALTAKFTLVKLSGTAMPELIADLPAVAILLPAASVYFLWALFHWIFRPGDDQLIDETQEPFQDSDAHTADFSGSLPDTAQSDRSDTDAYVSAATSGQDVEYLSLIHI